MCAPFSLTKDIIEIQLQTNYLAHFHLTSLLLPVLLSTASASQPNTVRIINISSDAHRKLAPKAGFEFSEFNLERASTWTRYGQSKFAQVVHAKELARRFGERGLVALSVHPGTVKTGLSAGPRGSSWWYRYLQPFVEWGAAGPERGAWGVLWCALGRLGEAVEWDPQINGYYLEKIGRLGRVKREAESKEIGERLWEWSEGVLKKRGF